MDLSGSNRGDQMDGVYARFGSASAGRPPDLAAGKLTLNLSRRVADVHGRQWTTLSCRSRFSGPARQPSLGSTRFAYMKQSLVATWSTAIDSRSHSRLYLLDF